MTVPARLALFGAALAIVAAGGAAAGAAIDPDRGGPADEAHADTPKEHSEGGAHGAARADSVRGLAVAAGGLRLAVDDTELARGRAERLRFRVTGADGATVSGFDVEHERRMHLIVARRDLTAFQHLHPSQAGDGSWSTDVRLAEPGSYRLFADFAHGGERYTLATDLRVDGEADLRPLPRPVPVTRTAGGYEVTLETGPAQPGQESQLVFTVRRDGVPVETESYLGAGGHLVALREGDLGFMHVHPTADKHGAGRRDHAVGFAATFPTPGRYRLFLQFKHAGRVETAAFTHEVS